MPRFRVTTEVEVEAPSEAEAASMVDHAVRSHERGEWKYEVLPLSEKWWPEVTVTIATPHPEGDPEGVWPYE